MSANQGSQAGRRMVEQLRQVHQMLRDDIAALETALETLRDAAAAPEASRKVLGNLNIARDAWSLRIHCDYFCNALDAHHTLEDRRMFPVLLRNFPALEPVVRRLRTEHEQVDDLIGRARVAAARLDGEEATAAAARTAIGALAEHLRAHLTYEEESLNPYFNRMENDWHNG